MFNKRNDLSLEISDKYQKANLNNMNGHSVRLDLDFIQNEIGISNFVNYLTVSEMSFQQLDSIIKDLDLLSHELPQIFNHYFSRAEYREKSFQHEIANFDPLQDPNDEINQPFFELDIDLEVSKLIAGMKLKNKSHRPFESWYEKPYSY